MAADAGVVVARRGLDDFLERRELLDPQLLKADRIEPDFTGELRDVEHLLFALADVAVDEVPVQVEIILRQDGQRLANLLLRDALLEVREDPIVRRFDAQQEHFESRLLELVQQRPALGDVDPRLDDELLLDPVFDDQVAELLGPLGIGEQVVVAEEHDVRRDGLELLDHRLERTFCVFALLAERIETERAEFALERAPAGRQDGVECVAAEPDAVLRPVIIMASQRAVGEYEMRQVRQLLVGIVHDLSVLAIGQAPDFGVGNVADHLPNDLFALAPHDQVDVRAAGEQVLDLFRGLAAADHRGNLGGQLRDEVADALEFGVPLDPDAQQVDLGPNEPAERLGILVSSVVPKVQQGDFVHKPLEACGDVFLAGGGEHAHRGRRVAEAGIQHQYVPVSCH
jgi:hypothetical protein